MPAGVPTTPVVSGNLVFVSSTAKTLYVLSLDKGSLLWSYDPPFEVSGSWATPVISGSRIYYTSNVGTVYCFRPAGADVHYIGSWDPTAHLTK